MILTFMHAYMKEGKLLFAWSLLCRPLLQSKL